MGAVRHVVTMVAGPVAGGVTAVSVSAAAGHGSGGLVAAAAGVLAAAITVAGREWFWLQAQQRPFREMRWLLKSTGSIADTELLMAVLQESYEAVLKARVGDTRGKAK